ncbi:MAG TPA: helix-turn-helix domain-containing protein [Xanthobacteraceae bacterium]|nr:helix-turn-helix domain-containing protein [Xanthobacteraceae bacterium]
MYGNFGLPISEPFRSEDLLVDKIPRRGPMTWQVRRAEYYIEMHWNEPITIERLVRATAASARSIFLHFKISRGQSPMSFVKEVRLQHAREMLQQTGPAHTVTGTAVACGFGNLGHFSGDYFKRFGELPSETLRRSKCLLPT